MDSREIKRTKITLGTIAVLMGCLSVIMSLLGILSINCFHLQEIFVGKHRQAVIAVLTVCVVGMCMTMIISGSIHKTKRLEEFYNFIHKTIITLFILWIVIGNPLEKFIFIINIATYLSAISCMTLLRAYRLKEYRMRQYPNMR